MGARLLAFALLATFLSPWLATPAAARLPRVRRFAEEESGDSWAVRTSSQRARPVYRARDANVDAVAEESVRQVEVQAVQRSTPGPRYLPTPSARRKDAPKSDGKSTPGPRYLPTPATTAYTDADEVTKVTRQETTWYTVTSSHVRSSIAKRDSGAVTGATAATSTPEISNDVRPKPSHRRGRVRYRSSVPDSRTRNASASRASRRRTTNATTAPSVDDKSATPEATIGPVHTAASKRVTTSTASTTTLKPHTSKVSTLKPVAQNASTNAHKSAVASTASKKLKQDSTVKHVGTLETQKIPASFWKSLREELLNTAAEEGPETKKEVRETKDASSGGGAGTGGIEVKAKVSAEAGGSSTKSCSRFGGEERGNHTVAAARRKANETAKATAAPRAAVTKAAEHASGKSAATTAKSSPSTAGRQSSGKNASTPFSGGTTPISRETSTSTPEKKQHGSGSRTEAPKQAASTKKAEPVADAKRTTEAASAGLGGHQKVTPAAS